MTRAKKEKSFLQKYWLLLVVVIILVVAVAGYLLGYRIGSGVTLSRVGTLTIQGLPAGATVYIDEESRGTAGKNGTMSFELVGGSHNVIVSVTGDYPWNDLVSIASGKTTSADPILIPERPDVTTLTGTDAATAIASIASTTLPTEAQPLYLANGCAAVYVSNNQVIANAVTSNGCTPPPYLCLGGKCSPTIIFSPVAKLSGVFKYPGRQDALVVGFNNTLYALALDPRSPQYFAPVLIATNPIFGTLSDGTIVIENIVGAVTTVFSVKL